MSENPVMREAFRSLHRLVLRVTFYPFTATTCGLLAFTGFLTLTATGQNITRRTIEQVGWAPRDLVALDVGRTAFSALVTNGGYVFWMALVLTALFVGAAEQLGGSAVSAVTFWGVHFVTMGMMLAVSLPLHLAGFTLGTLVYATRDVGPSAGYVGCLGLALVLSSRRWRWWALGAIWAWLLAALAWSIAVGTSDPAGVSANLAHAIALPLGAVFGLVVAHRSRSRQPRSETPRPPDR